LGNALDGANHQGVGTGQWRRGIVSTVVSLSFWLLEPGDQIVGAPSGIDSERSRLQPTGGQRH
jgi:hypothetical protein